MNAFQVYKTCVGPDWSSSLPFISLEGTDEQMRELVIIDAKSSSRVKLAHRVQVLFYAMILEDKIRNASQVSLNPL